MRTGPVLLEDFEVLEKIATLDREVLPERVVHARGTSAKGVFKVRCFSRRAKFPRLVPARSAEKKHNIRMAGDG